MIRLSPLLPETMLSLPPMAVMEGAGGRVVSTEKANGSVDAVLPAASVCVAVMDLPLP